MSEPSSSDSREEQMEAIRPGESEITVQSSARKYMKTSEGLPLAVSTLEPSLKELQDVVPSSQNAGQQNLIRIDVQQNVTMKGAANMTFGGTQNVSTLPPAYHNLLQRTISKLDNWTKGIVETAALKKVMDKINKGVSWVTIKGCPGEGKTTTARMALNELHKADRKIFDVTTPEEFRTIVTTCQDHPVVMLDDVFGNLEFDKTEWSKWKQILLKTLDDHQQYSEDNEESSASGSSSKGSLEEKMYLPKHNVTVILVGRQYVLNVCVSDLGKVAEFFTHEKHVVNMPNPEQRDFEEKIRIWKAISASNQEKLDDDTIQKICKIPVPHGFPHVCRLFVTLREKNPEFSAETFFYTPLEFLNKSIAKLIQNKEKRNLFKAMLENGGKITAREIEDHKDQDMIYVATELDGTYLRKEDDSFMFDHPSVYDSVAYNMCTVATSFVIENCEMNFIHERIRLRRGNELKTDSHLVVSISRDYIPELATRFAKEISEGKFSQSLCHQAFTDAKFVAKTMSLVTVDLHKLVVMQQWPTTEIHSFWTYLSSNGSPELLKYVEEHYEVSRKEYELVLYGVCLFAATDVLCYMEEKKRLNVNVALSNFDKTAALMAAKGRNKSFVDKIMSLNPNVHTRDSSGQTVLHVLSRNGLKEAVEKAIKNGADIECRDGRRSTPLVEACKGGHEKIVRSLIEKGARVDIRDVKGSTPLLYACKANNENMVRILIKAGSNTYGDEFLEACKSGNIKLVKLLFMEGVSVKDIKGLPLHIACWLGFPEIAKFLLANGSDVNAKDDKGNTPLHLASSDECCNILLNFKPNLLEKNQFCETVLHTAASRGFKIAVNTMIQEKPEIEARNGFQETPLFCASRSGSSECVKLLIDAGAKVTVRNQFGDTPLHVVKKSAESARLLVKAGASLNARNDQHESPLINAFSRAGNQAAILDFFLKEKADVFGRDENDNTSLHLAATNELHHVIPMLLKAGVNPQFTNVGGETALHVFMRNVLYSPTYISVITDLIRHGADVNSQDVNGDAPIHCLYNLNRERYKEILKLLVNHGADINIRNSDD